MQAPPFARQEAERQAALDALEILDTPADPFLDSLVATAQRVFAVNTALVSLLDHNRQWFKARVGLDCAQTSREVSFCGHTILERDCLVIENALNDPRFANNPLVTGAPYIRFYAGMPLFFMNRPIGTLCLLHPRPREFNAADRLQLEHLANIAQGLLTLHHMGRQTRRLRHEVSREHRQALLDPLTQLWNRRGMEEQWDPLLHSLAQRGQHLGAVFADLDHFKAVNDELGHLVGDQVLWAVARRLSATTRPDDLLVRFGGEEFLLLTGVSGPQELEHIAERLRHSIGRAPISTDSGSCNMTLSLGAALLEPNELRESLLRRADMALYAAKHAGRNRTCLAEPTTR